MPFIIAMGVNVYPASAANEGRHDISCGDHRYFIEESWFSADVSIINIDDNAATEHPYCQSNAAHQMVAKLSVNGDDIWCVKTFYISMDRQPIAKTSRLLSLDLGRVVEYEYIWRNGEWVKTDIRKIKCAVDKEPKRQKVLD
ncbi:hypothetical protein OAQ37_01730 [Alphaproteobacteria bacterium]|nr:hypothetical protein [Alphaproteobacteria bacterium]